MSCCGKGTSQPSQKDAVRSGGGNPGLTRGMRVRPLEYTGATALTVLGPVSGRVYRFSKPGSRLQVDPRDWSALSRLPMIR